MTDVTNFCSYVLLCERVFQLANTVWHSFRTMRCQQCGKNPILIVVAKPVSPIQRGRFPRPAGVRRSAYGVIFPILLPFTSVNQRLPSGPAAMLYGNAETVGTGYSVIAPPVVIFPILLPLPISVNQRLPSEPAAIPCGTACSVGMRYSVITPPVVIFPILLSWPSLVYSVNQRLPSGPATTPNGDLNDVLPIGREY